MKLKIAVIAFLLFNISSSIFAQAPDFNWAVRAGGDSASTYGNNVAVDKSGNIIVTGVFYGIASFGNFTLTSSGSGDVFIAKYDPAGNVIWAKSAGSSNYDYGNSVAVDNKGNIYVTGGYSDSANFDSNILYSLGYGDVFLAKYSSNGNLIWVRDGGSEYDDYGNGVTTDPQGNAVITGQFYYTAIFGSQYLIGPGLYNLYVIKYDPQGNILWARSAGGSNLNNNGQNVAANSKGDILVAGSIGDTVNFDGITAIATGYSDAIIAKYDANGNIIWVKHAGGAENYDIAYGIAIDRDDNIYFNGYFSGTAFFGNIQISSLSDDDIFIAKYDTNGLPVWVKRETPTSSNNYAGNICSDPAGNLTMTATASPFSFEPGKKNQKARIGSNLFNKKLKAVKPSQETTVNNYLYIYRYNKDGKKMWSKSIYSADCGGINNDPNGDVILNGSYYDQAYFDNIVLNGIGYPDAFVAKIPSPHLSGPAAVSFGYKSSADTTHYIAVGDTASRYIGIKNISNAPLNIFNISVIAPKNDFLLDPLTKVDSITANQEVFLHVNYTAKALSSKAYLQIVSDASTSPDTVTLLGYGAPIPLVYSADSLNFGNVDVKDTLVKILRVSNNGNFTVKLLSQNLTNQSDFISGLFDGSVPDSIKPKTFNDYKVKFNPQSVGIKTGRLILSSNSSKSLDTINLAGTGINRSLSFTSKQLIYGNIDIGDSLKKSVTITNSGTVDIIISNKNLTSPSDFNLSEISVPDTIKTGKSKSYNIKFSPSTVGIRTGKLILISNSKSSPDTINLTGTGIIRALTFSTKQVNYGNVDVSGFLEKTITITNSGTVGIIFSNKNLTNQTDFSLVNPSITDTIQSLKSKDYTIRFNPQSVGIKTGKLIFISNSKTSPDTVNLSGIGIQRALTISTRELNYGNVDVGDSLKKSVTITNSGTVAIIFSSKSLTNQTDFNLSGASIIDSIQAGKSKDYNIRFSPLTSGNKTGKLNIN